jgi:hypothetical protein
MIPSLPTVRTNWLELQSKLLPKYKESNICVAGGMKVILFYGKLCKSSLIYKIHYSTC